MKEQLWGGRQSTAPLRRGEREGASRERERRGTRALKLSPLTTLSSVLAAAPAGRLAAPSLSLSKLCSATWSQLYRSEGPPKFSSTLIWGLMYSRKKERTFAGIADTFIYGMGGEWGGKKLEQNKSKQRKTVLLQAKLYLETLKWMLCLYFKAFIFFFSSLKRSP